MKHSMCWLIGFASLGLAATVSEAPAQEPSVSIQTEYLGTMEVQLDAPQAVGPVLIFNVPGGTLKGPKINGTVVAPSADWLNIMPDGSLRLDVRASLKTDDGEFILIAYNGIIASTKEVMDRFNKGEVITSNDEYFLTAPRFTTASKKYDWLNRVQAVGKMVMVQQGKLTYDLFVVR
jgi:subtilisin-like proprotein convertase family protein